MLCPTKDEIRTLLHMRRGTSSFWALKIARFNTRRQKDRGRDKLAPYIRNGLFVALRSARNDMSMVRYE